MEFLNINPVFLFILFAMGYVFGLLIKNPTAGKFLIFGFFGIFIYEPIKDAGLLASAAFIFGVIIHHVNPLAVLDSFQLYRATKVVRDHYERDDPQVHNNDDTGSQKRAETADETYEKYEQHRREKQRQKAEQEPPKQERDKARQKAKPSGRDSAAEDAMRKAQQELKWQQDRLKADQQKLREERAQASGAVDTRTPEEILGLRGEFTLADVKKAWRSEAARWHPDQLRNKPPHLVKQAEEELKRINTAYDTLKKRFN